MIFSSEATYLSVLCYYLGHQFSKMFEQLLIHTIPIRSSLVWICTDSPDQDKYHSKCLNTYLIDYPLSWDNGKDLLHYLDTYSSNSFFARGNFCHLIQPLQTVWTQIRTDRMLALILIRTECWPWFKSK